MRIPYDKRGFFAIGIENCKTPDNMGSLWRAAHGFGAAYVFTIGARYPERPVPTDTTKAARHIPLFEFPLLSGFFTPRWTTIVGIETDDVKHGKVFDLSDRFLHPHRSVYILGSEDKGISESCLDICDFVVTIPSTYCLNVAMAGAIVMHDRAAKERRRNVS